MSGQSRKVHTAGPVVEGPPLIAFAGPSGVGKTTLLVDLVQELRRRGLRPGTLKHSPHPHALDRPGSDSARLRAAGAEISALCTPEGTALQTAPCHDPRELAARFYRGCDLVLVEGFRSAGLPTIQVSRAAVPIPEGWEPPVHRIGWATDHPVEDGLPVLPLADAVAIVDLILERLR